MKFNFLKSKDDYEIIMTPIRMQRTIEDLERRIQKLESETCYVSDDYQSFGAKPYWVPLNTVIRAIANHLGLQMHYKPAQEQGFVSEFKRSTLAAAKGKK
jgi:hypothetical protein